MGTRRLGLALCAALVVSVLVTSGFYWRITHGGARPKVKRIVGAAVALQPGTPIAADQLSEITWPETVSLDGLIEKKDEVVGRVLSAGVAANGPVLRRDLASSSNLGLTAKIPDGMRASAVKTNEVMNVAGFIFPGSRVDVLVTLRGEGNNASTTTTRTVLQNVQVLSTGSKMTPDPSGKPENVTVVTLLVTPEESEKLALAQNQGTLQFVLRNGGDSTNPATPAVDLAELTGRVAPPPPAATKRIVAAKPATAAIAKVADVPTVKPPEAYVVETVANGKVTTAKFPVDQQ
jgi:pilus assembly protein CpaB